MTKEDFIKLGIDKAIALKCEISSQEELKDFIPKAKFNEVSEENKTLKQSVSDRDKQLEDLKKSSGDNATLQQQISDLQQQNSEQQKAYGEELAKLKLNNAVKVALYGAKAADVDYLTFKLNESLNAKNEALELDENDKIKGWDNRLSELKAQFPNMFNSDSSDGYKLIGDNRLPEGSHDTSEEPKNLADALRMQYENERND